MVAGNVLPYLTRRNGTLALHKYYFDTDSSENKHGAYYIGQGLTKLFAEQHLGAPIILHAHDCQHTRAVGNAGKAPGVEIGRKLADLIAFDGTMVHVLEAKGRSVLGGSGVLSTSVLNSALQTALAQVSAVQSVNGRQPASRCACVWTLCTSGISGDIWDPDGDGWDVKATDNEVLKSNYGLFLDIPQDEFQLRIIPDYSMAEIVVSKDFSFYIGIKTNLYNGLKSGHLSVEEAIRFAESSDTKLAVEGTAFLTDGTIIYIPKGSDF